MIKNTNLMNVMDEEIKLYDIHPSDFIKTQKKQSKKNLLASFAFVHGRLLPKVLYCQCRLVACHRHLFLVIFFYLDTILPRYCLKSYIHV
jgi:hypothetical protein